MIFWCFRRRKAVRHCFSYKYCWQAILLAGLCLLGAPISALGEDTEPELKIWNELESGFEVGRFNPELLVPDPQGQLVVLRIDPHQWDLKIFLRKQEDGDRPRKPQQWCEEFGLEAAINVGMYQEDYSTNVGYCKVDGSVENSWVNDYMSAMAFDPIDPARPKFRIFDLDVTPLKDITAAYNNVVQNMRLVKRFRENRWRPQGSTWPEAALAEDDHGRALLIYCSVSYSMHEFNEVLLGLPLNIVCAQHLEGNNPARLWINHPALAGEIQVGASGSVPAIPNVLGVAKRHPQNSSH